MKLFHISDLHIGKILHEVNLLEEQKFVLEQVLALVDLHMPDGILIAGDIYDKAVPSAEAVKVFDAFLSELAVRGLSIFLISGNHDSSERIHFASQILQKQNVFVKGVFDGKLEAVKVKDQEQTVSVYLLPYIRPFDVRPYYPEEEITSYDQAVRTVLAHTDIDEAEVNILVAHQFITGAVSSESETVMVGGIDNISADAFSMFDYVALGHLHRAQKVKRETVRYCGTLFPYSFDPNEGEKSVTMITIGQEKAISIDTLAIHPRHALRTICGSLQEVLSGEVSEDYVKAVLTDGEDQVDVVPKLRDRYPNLLTVEFEGRKRTALAGLANAEQIAKRSPLELFAEFFQERSGQELDEEDRLLVEQMMRELSEGGESRR